MGRERHKIKAVVPVIVFAVLAGCTTQKNTMVTRTFHNITSRYNIFFNGSESFKQGVKKAEENFQDDYTRMLPVFTYGNEEVAQAVGPDMDRCIKKATKVVTLHSITVKPELKNGPQTPKEKAFYARNEYNRYVPENYLLMGKAYLYRHDFSLALETFKYILSEYPHMDVVFETRIWLARLYDLTGEYNQAGDILDALTAVEEVPKKLRGDLYATLADHYMRQKQYSRAIGPLTRALEHTSDKDKRVRYAFILGQLHQEAGDPVKASAYYRRVIKMNPPYEMSFSARVNRASVYEPGSGNLKDITSELRAMIRDEKNREYRDQIYFALGNIYKREGQVDQAIINYKLSSETSVSNVKQKTTTCLQLADIYYNRNEYQLASAYYDTASSNLSPEYPGYRDIMLKSGSLSRLVESLNTVAFEDSVQRLAAMDEEERLALIDTLIARVTLEEKQARDREGKERQDQQYNRMMLSQNRTGGYSGGTQGGKWYFYNQAAKSFGQPEFRMKWGNRKLEDNWRRKNKSSISFGEVETASADSASGEIAERKVLDNKSREFYLQDIPLTDSMMEKSDERKMQALASAGMIYKNDLKDYEASNKEFMRLLDEYPEGPATLQAYYNLYTNYGKLENTPQAERYRSAIIRDFPDSEVAGLLTDPDYIEKLEKKENQEQLFYEQVFNEYRNGQYSRVIADVKEAFRRFPESDLKPRYAFLRAMSLGATSDRMTFTLALDSLIKAYPGEEVTMSARNVLSMLKQKDPNVRHETQKREAEEIYRHDSAGVYYYGLVVNRDINVNQLRFEIINFNLDYYPQSDFDVTDEPVNTTDHLVLVKSFPNLSDAWAYHDSIAQAGNVNGLIRDTGYQRFIISDVNTQTLIRDKVSEKYLVFFNKYYAEPQKPE